MARRTRTLAVPLGAMLAVTLLLAVTPAAAAPFRQADFVGSAHWTTDTPPPGETDPSVIELIAAGGFGHGAVFFDGVEGALPGSPPTYDFQASATGGSGGSPRLILRMSDGVAELRPATVAAGAWVHMDGLSSWETKGGTCPYLHEVSYAQVLACHEGETVTGMDIWNDSAWLFPDTYRVLVDNIRYRDEVVSNEADEIRKRPPPPPSVPSEATIEASPGESGVRVQVPTDEGGTGTFVPLSEVTDVPVGSVIDASQGAVTLETAPSSSGALDTGTFSQGAFLIAAQRTSAGGLTVLRMRGGASVTCRPDSALAARLVRRLYSNVRRRPRASASRAGAAVPGQAARGGFRVRARFSTATAQDAAWVTVDNCEGIRTRVTRGTVTVRDLRSGLSQVLGPGESRLIRR